MSRKMVFCGACVSLATLLIVTLGSTASGQSMNVSVNSGPPSAAFGAGAAQTGQWNLAPVKGKLLPWPLFDLSGASTPVVFNTPTPGYDLWLNDPGTFGDDEKLLDGGHNIGPIGATQWDLTGLQNGNYDVYTYAWTPTSPNTLISVSVPGSPDPAQTVGGPFTGSYVLGTTHAKHTVSVSNGQLTIAFVQITSAANALVNGFQLVKKDSWTDLGHALAGSSGAPLLAGFGDLTPLTAVGVSLTNALPGSTVIFVVGGSSLNAPLFGGVIVPFPNIILPPIPTGAAGSVSLNSTMPAGVPSAIPIFIQGWIPDPLGPQGWAASNALMATTP